jgi:hypothetical protein
MEIIQKTGPLREKIASDIATRKAPIPTWGIYSPIKDYFTLASMPTCGSVEDNNFDTLETISCSEGGITVQYDQWLVESGSEKFLESRLTPPGMQVLVNNYWYDGIKPEVKLGRFIIYTNKDGQALICWTVYGKQLSGWAIRADGDLLALYQWWQTSGSQSN